MDDLSLHVLDIAENAIGADATRIGIVLALDRQQDLLLIEISDDGNGMDAGTLARIRDPFFTTKGKKTGLGIPLLAQAAEQAGGGVVIDSAPGKGTRVAATFRWSHPDRPAIGNMAETVMTLIGGRPDVDIVLEERDGDTLFRLDTRELKNELEDVPINSPAALGAVKGLLQEQIKFEM